MRKTKLALAFTVPILAAFMLFIIAMYGTEWSSAEHAEITPLLPGSHQATSQNSQRNLLVIPAMLEYEYFPEHFAQWITDNPQYSFIEADIDEGTSPVYRLSLTDKTSGRKIYFSNSEQTVKSLTPYGKSPFKTDIKFHVKK